MTGLSILIVNLAVAQSAYQIELYASVMLSVTIKISMWEKKRTKI